MQINHVAVEAKKLYRTERIYNEDTRSEKHTFIVDRLKIAGIDLKKPITNTYPQLHTARKVIYPSTIAFPKIAEEAVANGKTLCLIPNDSIQCYIRYTRRHSADTIIIKKETLAEIIYILKKVTPFRPHTHILPYFLRRYLYREIHNLFGGNLKHIIILGRHQSTKGIDKTLGILGITTSFVETRAQETKPRKQQNETGLAIHKILKDICKKEFTEDQKLVQDLGLDSLTRVELVAALEDDLGVSINEQDIDEKTTVQNLIDMAKHTKFDIAEVTTEIKLYKKRQLMRFSQILREILRNTIMILIQNVFITKITIYGKENLAEIHNPSILVFNHVGHLDSSVVLRILPHRIRVKLTALADIRLYFNPMGSFLLRYFGNAYPLDKWGGPVRESLEIASDLIADGWSVLLAPEGAISRSGDLQNFKLGSATLISQTNVPVVPFKIEGYKKLFPQVDYKVPLRRVPVTIKIGKPVYLNPNLTAPEISNKMREIVEKL